MNAGNALGTESCSELPTAEAGSQERLSSEGSIHV